MSIENPSAGEGYETGRRHKETPARLRLAAETFLRLSFGKIEVKGEENLNDLPPDTKVVLAATHISDADLLSPIAKLGNRFNIRVAAPSLHFNVLSKEKGDAMPALSLKMAGGEDVAMPIDYGWEEHREAGRSYVPGGFNPLNFEPMKDALDEGNIILIAAYSPPAVKDGKLPRRGGYGDVYLAEIADAVIVPIAVDVKSDDPHAAIRKKGLTSLRGRPDVAMTVGAPIVPGKIEGIDDLAKILGRRAEGAGGITQEELARVKEIQSELRKESNRVMAALAAMLPEGKRGPWASSVESSDGE